jgi:hypothetical protein
MTRSASASLQRSEFEDFLFAPIGEESNGMSLSVISALARLDLDPWLEAGNLARMPTKTATERVAQLISSLPERKSARLDPEAIAIRLIALLPRQGSSKALKDAPARRAGAAINSQVIAIAILLAFLLSTQFLKRSRESPAQTDGDRAPASSTVSPPGLER